MAGTKQRTSSDRPLQHQPQVSSVVQFQSFANVRCSASLSPRIILPQFTAVVTLNRSEQGHNFPLQPRLEGVDFSHSTSSLAGSHQPPNPGIALQSRFCRKLLVMKSQTEFLHHGEEDLAEAPFLVLKRHDCVGHSATRVQ